MPQPTLLILARSKLGRFCWITSATFGNNNDINLFRKNFKTLETNRRKSTASSQADITHQQYSLFHQCLSSGHLPHKEEVNQRQVRSQPRLRSTMGSLRLSCPRRSPSSGFWYWSSWQSWQFWWSLLSLWSWLSLWSCLSLWSWQSFKSSWCQLYNLNARQLK